MPTETIVAIATPIGIGGIGIVRISGEKSLAILEAISGIKTPKPRYVYYTKIKDPDTHSLLEEACVIYFKGPKSYTGEDTVEIQGHSSPYILEKILEISLRKGAVLALPGEFTKRAFINGKLSLMQAESVIDLIHSTNAQTHQVALAQLQGTLMTEIEKIRSVLIEILEQIEGSIDFPEEVPAIDRQKTASALQETVDKLDKSLSLKEYGEKIKSGLRFLIVGIPNAGKSSLLNAILGKERAIVTEKKGTTRDYLEVTVSMGGIDTHWIDTAGIRETEDEIEKKGIEKISELLKKADAVFWLVEGTKPLTQEDRVVEKKIKAHQNILIIKTKSDKEEAKNSPLNLEEYNYPCVSINTKTKDGLDELKSYLFTHFIPKINPKQEEWVANIRQIASLQIASEAIHRFINGLQTKLEEDVIAIDLKEAILKLGEVTGNALTEEVLDGIFSRFCVGK